MAGAGVVGGLTVDCKKTADPTTTKTAATKFDWTLVTTRPPNFPIFQEGVQRFADDFKAMNDGRLNIQWCSANSYFMCVDAAGF